MIFEYEFLSGYTDQVVCSALPDDRAKWSVPECVLQKRLTQVLIKWSLLPESLATWEDLEFLKQQFSQAPVWGQLASQSGGNVSNENTAASSSVDQDGPRAGTRLRKPNPKIHGPDWVQALACV